MKIKNYLLFSGILLFQCTSNSGVDYLVKPKYEQVIDFSEGYASVKKNGKWGFIDSTGKEIISPKYQHVSPFRKGLAVVTNQEEKWGSIDYSENIIVPFEYDLINHQHDLGDFLIVYQMGMNGNMYEAQKAGLLNLQGEAITAFKYEDISYNNFSAHPSFLEYYQNEKIGLLSFEGEDISPAKYDIIQGFAEGFACVWIGDKVGFINQKGEEITPIKYGSFFGNSESAFYMNPGFSKEGLAVVAVATPSHYSDFYDFVYGYIDITGKEIIPIQYEQASSFSEGIARVKKEDTEYGYIDTKGKEIIPLQFLEANFPKEGFVSVKAKNNKWGFFNTKGEIITSAQYNYVQDFQEGMAVVKNENDKWGFINQKGEEVITCQYEEARDFENGYAVVQKENENGLKNWGLIDKSGKEIIPLQYEDIDFFQENGLIWVKKKEKWGLINYKLESLTPFKYDVINSFEENGLARVKVSVPVRGKKDRYEWHITYVDTLGNEIFPLHRYGGDNTFHEEVLAVEKDDKWGFVNQKGELVVPTIFEEVRDSENGIIAIRLGEKWGFIRNPEK